MTIGSPPIQAQVIDKGGLLSRVWTLWAQSIVRRVNEGDGVTSTFTTVDAKTVTVTNGIITDIT